MSGFEQMLHEDEVNRARALELASFIVEAPAGAGKTELLTQRYLRLLQTVREPEEIVAITFTNKAAAEMRVRILDSLNIAASGVPPSQPHKSRTYDLATAALATAEKFGWNLLQQPGRLRINTIDSLCSHLARQMPLLSRFGAQPGVCQDASLHYEEAVRRTLMLLEESGAEASVVADALQYLENDLDRLSRLLASMLARRDQWLHHTHQHSAQEDAELALGLLVENDLGAAAAVLNERVQAHLMPVARYAASNLPCEHPLALLADWETPISTDPEALPLWRALCDLLLTSGNTLRAKLDKNIGLPATDAAKPFKEALLDAIATLRESAGAEDAVARIRRLPLPRHGDAEWQIIGIFAQLLNLAAAQLWMVFQQAGEVDFVEISRRALQALEDTSGAPTELALRLDYRIQHLLVDEFQDTSPAQVELLRCLTQGWMPGDGRTLFCVGDPMQSIYRFRKAEVGLFLRMAERGIDNVSLTRLRLCRNNRSCPEVVDWVNRAFVGVFPATDSVMQGAISYRDFVATRDSLPGAGVEVHALVLAREATAAAVHAREAQCIVEIIRRERAQDPRRRIAVLVRARNHLEALAAEIRQHSEHRDLRFQAVEIEALAGRQIVQDLLALSHALHHRADRVHWLAILRAPWCGLRLADLHVLAASDHRSTIWSLMNEPARVQMMSEDGRQRLLHVRAVLSEALAQRGRQPVRRWVEGVWLQLGGASCLWEAGDVRDVQAFFELVQKLEEGGRFSTELLAREVEKLFAAPDTLASDALQFMTIHKSKGLEFDTVILPGLHRGGASDDKSLLLWEEVALEGATTQLVAAPLMPKRVGAGVPGNPSAYDYLRLLEQERSDNEAARVLYVGATRAVRRLHLVGVARQDARSGEPKPPANTPLALLWSAVGGIFMQAAVEQVAPDDDSIRNFIPPLVRLVRPGVPAQLDRASVSIVADVEEIPAAESPGSRLDADIGMLAHRYVEIMARADLAGWTPQRVRDLQPAMQHWLLQQGYDQADARRGASRVSAALDATLASEQGRWVLQQRDHAVVEMAWTSIEGARVRNHVIDRTFIENGERWVIDYKSARLGEVSADVLERQAALYRPQLERYAGLFADEGLPVRRAVFFLAHGILVELT